MAAATAQAATAAEIYSTPMSAYIDIMKSMNRKDKEIVVAFLLELLKETPEPFPKKSNLEIIKEKYKFFTISKETKELLDGLTLTKDDLKDERTRYILGLDK